MPSSTAARVAFRASVTLSFFSETSTSLAPPTFRTAMPPDSFARRSWSFSFSYSEEEMSIDSLSSSHLSLMASLLPRPSRTIVSSLVTVTFFAEPNSVISTLSRVSPTSSLMTCPPVSTAISCRLAFRLSPKPGALTAQTLMPPRSLLTTSVAKASLSTSSAMISRGLLTLRTISRMGRMVWSPDTFFSYSMMSGFSSSHFWVLLFVMK
mmetsp:Transcript_24962/g.43106  ORF Transcript_24962/g.43106 Transcript_24962/m.43106 type:complete len:209 (+) Transcript_24962:728-1354(+)